jgi:hypothetical protein
LVGRARATSKPPRRGEASARRLRAGTSVAAPGQLRSRLQCRRHAGNVLLQARATQREYSGRGS